MSDDELGATGGTQPDYDELLPKGKTFKNPEEEIAFWRQLAFNHKTSHRRLSDQLSQERESMGQMKAELGQLKTQVENFTTGRDKAKTTPSGEREKSYNVDDQNACKPIQGPIPKLTIFTGDDGKNEYPYLNWRFDVQQLIHSGYPPRVVCMAINRSCRGTASTALLALGRFFEPDSVIAAFDKRFASVETKESLLSKFYRATQKGDESMNTWGCRLEALLTRPQLDQLRHHQKESMLRERFWRGLNNDSVRNALRHRFDAGATYEELLVCAREVEAESPTTPSSSSSDKSSKSSKKAQVSQAQASDNNVSSQLADILARVIALEQKMQNPTSKHPKHTHSQNKGKTQQKGKSGNSQPKDSTTEKKITCFNCKKDGHYRSSCPDLKDA